jgi:hypothetical protein
LLGGDGRGGGDKGGGSIMKGLGMGSGVPDVGDSQYGDEVQILKADKL